MLLPFYFSMSSNPFRDLLTTFRDNSETKKITTCISYRFTGGYDYLVSPGQDSNL